MIPTIPFLLCFSFCRATREMVRPSKTRPGSLSQATLPTVPSPWLTLQTTFAGETNYGIGHRSRKSTESNVVAIAAPLTWTGPWPPQPNTCPFCFWLFVFFLNKNHFILSSELLMSNCTLFTFLIEKTTSQLICESRLSR